MRNSPPVRALQLCLGALMLVQTLSAVSDGPLASVNPLALKEVGTFEVRLLSPTLLELTLVTTKQPPPARVTQWDFVGPDRRMRLLDPAEFEVTVDGAPAAVEQVGFRRRPLYAPFKQRDLR